MELKKEISDFLNQIKNKPETTRGGFPVRTGSIEIVPYIEGNEITQFSLSTHGDYTGLCDGICEREAYFFKAEEFLPVIKELKEKGRAKISLDTICSKTSNSYDHSYDFGDDDNSSTREEGHAIGEVYLENGVLRYNLTLHSLTK